MFKAVNAPSEGSTLYANYILQGKTRKSIDSIIQGIYE